MVCPVACECTARLLIMHMLCAMSNMNPEGSWEWRQIMPPYAPTCKGRAEYWDGVSAGPVERALLVVVHLLILVLFWGGGQLQGHLSPPASS